MLATLPRHELPGAGTAQRVMTQTLMAQIIAIITTWIVGASSMPMTPSALDSVLGTVMVLTNGALSLFVVLCYFVMTGLTIYHLSNIRINMQLRVLCLPICMVPFLHWVVAILIWVALNREWRSLGVRVGWWGPHAADVDRLRAGELCFGCGYDLRGNVTGVCPECGREVGLRSA